MNALTEVGAFQSLLAQPGDVLELRGLATHHGQQPIESGYFDSVDELTTTPMNREGPR